MNKKEKKPQKQKAYIYPLEVEKVLSPDILFLPRKGKNKGDYPIYDKIHPDFIGFIIT